jgi:hypothetical protein
MVFPKNNTKLALSSIQMQISAVKMLHIKGNIYEGGLSCCSIMYMCCPGAVWCLHLFYMNISLPWPGNI